MAVPDLTEYVAATSAGGSSAGLSRPSLVRHRASLFISTRMPPENLLRVFIFLWSKTNGPSGGDFTFTRTVHFGYNAKMEGLGPFCWLAV